ncbi:MAG: MFS transporter [Jatrophihabitans sp.]
MSPVDSLRQLVVVRALSAFSYYTFTPFLPLWAERNLGSSPVTAGGALAVSLLATRAGGLVLPPLIDAIGYRRFSRLSYAGIAAGYLVIASQNRIGPVALYGLFAVIGLLQSGSTVALKASVAGLAGDCAGVRGFAALSMAINTGSAAGPVCGALLLDSGRLALPTLAAVTVAAAALAPLPQPAAEHPHRVAGRRVPGWRLVRFLLVASLTWLGYAVALDAMPTVASGLVDRRIVALAFALNAIVVVAAQPAMTRWLLGRGAGAGPARPLVSAGLLAGGGLGVLALLPWAGASALLLGVLIFSASELIWGPLYDAETLARAGRMSPTAAFGLAGCVFGVAESAATWSGVAIAGPGGDGRIAVVFGAAGAAALLAVPLLAALTGTPAHQPRQVSEVLQ